MKMFFVDRVANCSKRIFIAIDIFLASRKIFPLRAIPPVSVVAFNVRFNSPTNGTISI